MIPYILVSVLLICYLMSKWKKRKFYKLASKLKNNLSYLPVIGHGHHLIGSDIDRMNTFQQLGRICFGCDGHTSAWLGQDLFVVIADPESLEVIMKTNLDKGEIMSIIHDLIGNGSIFAPVPIWRPRRKVIAPTFSSKNLNQFVKVFSKQGSVMVEQLRTKAGKGTFSLWNYITTYTMDSVCETTLGIKVNAQLNPNQPFLDAFDKYCQIISKRICMLPQMLPIYKLMPSNKYHVKNINYMWEFVDKIVKKRSKEIKEKVETKTKEKNKDEDQKTFLELFIESSGGASGFTNLELREETLVLLLAGTDTSAVGAAFTCLMLASHPRVQDKVYAELQDVLGDSNKPVTAEDLPRLKYLEAVIKESLRLYPPVPVIVRKVEKDNITLPNGLELPKHTLVLINIWAVHRNPKYWGANSEEFRPERFLEQELKHPAAFMPFSYGPRSCLGYKYAMMSMQTAVSSLVRHYRVIRAGASSLPLKIKFDIMMKHVDNFELQLESRS